LEGATVTLPLAEFDRLRKDSEELDKLQKSIGNACCIESKQVGKYDFRQFVTVDMDSLSSVIRKYGHYGYKHTDVEEIENSASIQARGSLY
jgi:hypothetical protein